jgi:hypothetical protein
MFCQVNGGVAIRRLVSIDVFERSSYGLTIKHAANSAGSRQSQQHVFAAAACAIALLPEKMSVAHVVHRVTSQYTGQSARLNGRFGFRRLLHHWWARPNAFCPQRPSRAATVSLSWIFSPHLSITTHHHGLLNAVGAEPWQQERSMSLYFCSCPVS